MSGRRLPSSRKMEKESKDVEAFEELETGKVQEGTFRRYLVLVIAVSWSLFQLSLPKLILLNSTYSRCIHLAFAIALAFLIFPAQRRVFSAFTPEENERRRAERPLWLKILYAPFIGLRNIARVYTTILSRLSSIPGLDFVIAALASLLALYLALNFDAISLRPGLPSTMDKIVGIALVLFLLEATRRCVGWALPIVASVFILISFQGQSLGPFAFKNATLSQVVNKLSIGSEGIYGIPLDVSTNTVFLFVLFGALLASAGGAKYFIQLAYSIVGVLTGGPAMAAVLASGLTGMISGSSIANTVTTGTFTIPLMKRAGYSPVKAGAFEVAASTNGQLMPPVMGAAAFIMAEYCAVPYLDVVRAAVIPAVISYLALIYITYLEAAKLNLGRVNRSEVPSFRQTFLSGIYYFIPIIVLVVSLFVLRYSAQLAAFWAIVWLVAIIFVREMIRSIRNDESWLRGIGKAFLSLVKPLEAGALNMVSIGVAVASAGIVSGIIGLGAGSMISQIIALISGGNLYILLIVTAIFCLILGMGLPTTANYIVIASLVVPTMMVQAEAAGMVLPVLAAHLFCFYFGILSDDTPPVGLSAYAASAISGADPIKTGIQGFAYDIRTAILPFLFVFNTDLILHEVTSFWYGAAVFVFGLIAMLAFASLTRGWIRTNTSIPENLALGLGIFLLMLPNVFADATGLGRPAWIAIGLIIVAAVVAFNFHRSRQAQAT